MYEYGHKNIVENSVLCCRYAVKYRYKDVMYERKIFSYDCNILRKVFTKKLIIKILDVLVMKILTSNFSHTGYKMFLCGKDIFSYFMNLLFQPQLHKVLCCEL